MAEEKNETLKEARNVMTYLTGDEEVRRIAELREKWAIDRAFDMKNAKAEGEKDGENKKALEIAKRMLKKNKSVKEVVEMTGLTKEEVEQLK